MEKKLIVISEIYYDDVEDIAWECDGCSKWISLDCSPEVQCKYTDKAWCSDSCVPSTPWG